VLLINAIVNNALLTPTHTSNRITDSSSNHSHPALFCGRLAAPDFVTKFTEARAVRWPEVWKFYGSLTLLHFPTGGANDAQNVRVDTACEKDNDQQNLKKNDNVILQGI